MDIQWIFRGFIHFLLSIRTWGIFFFLAIYVDTADQYLTLLNSINVQALHGAFVYLTSYNHTILPFRYEKNSNMLTVIYKKWLLTNQNLCITVARGAHS